MSLEEYRKRNGILQEKVAAEIEEVKRGKVQKTCYSYREYWKSLKIVILEKIFLYIIHIL